ncbi:hypothetical protein NLM33_23160 [Bradyrhizobium sp. CCGUVB1N3]|uniref:hypothetical protein n=1 Tax=Bradyrhizobium sp. CCGUVB1N3 TaxID=2949629 RepID=UPI0020B286DC|nr:hypothetical protein [Bradyrhizobium sp. CCGUVB1N3]MCP3473216.1 hypothetical protein [Bradyrhizobium sp. CCGUVB1N3]
MQISGKIVPLAASNCYRIRMRSIDPKLLSCRSQPTTGAKVAALAALVGSNDEMFPAVEFMFKTPPPIGEAELERPTDRILVRPLALHGEKRNES